MGCAPRPSPPPLPDAAAALSDCQTANTAHAAHLCLESVLAPLSRPAQSRGGQSGGGRGWADAGGTGQAKKLTPVKSQQALEEGGRDATVAALSSLMAEASTASQAPGSALPQPLMQAPPLPPFPSASSPGPRPSLDICPRQQ